MGNELNSNDGFDYRGRGATQTTGHDGYRLLSGPTQLNLLADPDLVNDRAKFLECGVADFALCDCLPWAQADNIIQVTKHLNGGYTGLADRIHWLKRWKVALGV